MPGEKIQRAAERDARLIDALTDAFASELEQVLVLLNAKIRTLVRTLETDTTGRIVASQTNLALALRLRQDLMAALEAAGYHDLAVRAADDALDQLASSVLSSTQGTVVTKLGGFDLDALVALKEIRLADLLQVGEEVAVQLWRTVVDGVLGVRPVLDLVDDIADMLDISAKRARQIYDTAVSTFSQQVAMLGTTGEPDEAFFYVGPVDIKMREFCAEHVGKVFSRKVIDDMDNGQLPNVMLTRGGYNCRHAWRRVSALDEKLLALMDTGEVDPAVQRRLDDTADSQSGVAA